MVWSKRRTLVLIKTRNHNAKLYLCKKRLRFGLHPLQTPGDHIGLRPIVERKGVEGKGMVAYVARNKAALNIH